MAHLTTSLPWPTLASTLHLSPSKHPPNPDLHLRFRPDQASKLNYFVEALSRTVRSHAASTRAHSFPDGQITPPEPEEVVLDERIVARIAGTVTRWRGHRQACEWEEGLGRKVEMGCGAGEGCKCEEVEGQARWERGVCGCVVPMMFRRARGFGRVWEENMYQHQFFLVNGRGFFAVEVVKTLVLYGEMEVVLRLCMVHGEALRSWWRVWQYYRMEPDAGWDTLCRTALLPYLTLNLIHCFPESWDAASGRTDATDYRDMRIYQYMLKHCTWSYTTSEVATHPHRQFFGIADGQFHQHGRDFRLPRHNLTYPYGLVPYATFLACDDKTATRAPGTDDVTAVRRLLHRGLGLPMELVLEIMAMAGYEPRGRLRVAHDPFHPANRDELDKYLKYCWQVLVRCEMMGAALGMQIDWRQLASRALVELLSCGPGPRRWYRVSDDEVVETYTFV